MTSHTHRYGIQLPRAFFAVKASMDHAGAIEGEFREYHGTEARRPPGSTFIVADGNDISGLMQDPFNPLIFIGTIKPMPTP